MTAAFAVGQLLGPVVVSLLASGRNALQAASLAAAALSAGERGDPGRVAAGRRDACRLQKPESRMNPSRDRMPPLARESMDDSQRAAADALIAGPRKGVKGPFIPLLRSPRLLAPLQIAGEYLRFDSALPRRVSEFATLVVAQQWTQQFEWMVHVPLAQQEGTSAQTIEALRAGAGRPR